MGYRKVSFLLLSCPRAIYLASQPEGGPWGMISMKGFNRMDTTAIDLEHLPAGEQAQAALAPMTEPGPKS